MGSSVLVRIIFGMILLYEAISLANIPSVLGGAGNYAGKLHFHSGNGEFPQIILAS